MPPRQSFSTSNARPGRSFMQRHGGDVMGVGALLLAFGFIFSLALAWMTHVIVCIKASAWILLAFGCVVFPVGVIHGYAVWFGLI